MPEKPKILIVTTTSETLATILSGQPEFLSQYFDVAVCSSKDSHYDRLLGIKDVKVYPVFMKRGVSIFSDMVSLFLMVIVLLRVKPDIVHSYTPKAGLIAMAASWLVGVPVRIHTFTGLLFPTAQGLRKKILLFSDKAVAFFSTFIVPESKGVKDDLVAAGILNSDTSIIGHGNIAGVDVSYFSVSESLALSGQVGEIKNNLSTDAFVYCFIGRVNKDKGILELVDAFAKLSCNSELLIVGDLDENAPPSPDVLREMELNPRIHCFGFQPDIRPYLLLSDVLVLSSYREGFPNVVLQAMALQVPVISTNVSGAAEVVIPGETGWIVPVRDKNALHLAMNSAFYSGKKQLEIMGVNSRKIVVTRFERQRYLKELVKFYNSFID